MDIGAYVTNPVPQIAESPRIPAVTPAAGARPRAGTDSRRDSGEGQPDGRRPITVGDVVERNLTIDPDTRTVVYQALNARGEIVLQTPDQAIMRMRAYAREMRLAGEGPDAGGTVERVA